MTGRAFDIGFKLAFEKKAITEAPAESLWHRPISGTIGRLADFDTLVALGTLSAMKGVPTTGDPKLTPVVNAFREELEKDKRNGDELEIQYGGSRPLRNFLRMWKRKGTSLPSKLVGTLRFPVAESMKALTRGDSYDPFADVVNLYHNDPAILSHELGHVLDTRNRSWPVLYALGRKFPGIDLYQENLASKAGLKHIVDPEERKRAARVLGGGMGTYLASYLLPGGGMLGGLAGQAVGTAGPRVWLGKEDVEQLKVRDKRGKKEPSNA